MSQNSQPPRSWRNGIVAGALAFGLVSLPAAFAEDGKIRICQKPKQTKMCSPEGKPTCAKTKNIAEKEEKGFFIPAGGGDSPCPNEPASPT